ncbi:MAG: hypothetical protein E6J90_12245 [Deltaproteobacteria bacterium]|nr:MAG: hypothetical protein E6J91_29460 [Deltaproteobacteria bacterium]TMQ22644.1 MAG: hypothetical protein E6J90_12245 [Deltaproteobacteria bacterium]
MLRSIGPWSVLAIALAVAGCGDEGDATPPPQPAQPRPNPQAVGGPAAANRGKLAEKMHIEDRVNCPIPEQPTDPKDGKCDPKAPSCGEHLYCLALAQGNYCEPCAERDGIRHAFRERDFDGEHNRDPFQSMLMQVGPRPTGPTGLTKCPREDQLVATSYSYADLKLVGIVSQGTVRKALMMGGPLGYIIKRGDCVGKEKVLVKDIGTGYVTFQLETDEYSVQLNPKQLAINEPEIAPPAPRTTIAPVVSPKSNTPPPAEAPPPAAPATPATPRTSAGSALPAEAPLPAKKP